MVAKIANEMYRRYTGFEDVFIGLPFFCLSDCLGGIRKLRARFGRSFNFNPADRGGYSGFILCPAEPVSPMIVRLQNSIGLMLLLLLVLVRMRATLETMKQVV